MDFLKSKNRLGLYLFLLAVLALGALAAVWSVSGTGAYLTGEGDWQTLAGDYRIGIIDYNVKVNDQTLLGRTTGKDELDEYLLDVPILGGVKMFDSSVSDAIILNKEFNEGATLAKIRVTNYSKNMVDVTAQFSYIDLRTTAQIEAGVPPIRAMALPVTLTEKTAATFDLRKYILETVGNADSLSTFDANYATYMNGLGNKMVLEMGLLPGSTTADPGVGSDKVVQDGNSWCYYRDVFLVIWTEYGDGEFNTDAPAPIVGSTPDPTWTPTGTPRQGRFHAEFTVGQLD